MDLPYEHSRFLDRTLDYIKNDARMLGLAVAGSCITNTMDEFSDLDFVVVVSEAHYEQVMLERKQIASALGNLLVAFTGEHVGEPRLLICLYDHPLLHVDLKFVTRSDFQKRIEDPVILWERESVISDEFKKSSPIHPMPDLQWIEDRFWVWIHYMAVKLGRGELFEVIDCLTFIRAIALGPLSLVTHGQLPR
ncbi:nucleotidyltransferase domain-containing protein [Bdellovibrio bacteriovorus]|uniref:nucleotidyltransferase domain-containing protein n=1 Tax=Bdellovibrio bacteriovorus TaxID=959 RepID=UPI000A9FAFE8|nr:nucleotidyltransferase domain-containing protein [Bdellovibrio bacteriovorus]